MKVHVICHGLFGIVVPESQGGLAESPVEAVFLDAAGATEKFFVPRHDLFIRYTGGGGNAGSLRLERTADLELLGMPPGATEILSRPVRLADVRAGWPSVLRPECSGGEPGLCQLARKPLVRGRLKLHGGTLRNCEIHPVHGIDLGDRRYGWGAQHLEYEWSTGGASYVSKTANAVLYSFDSGGREVALRVGGQSHPLGEANEAMRERLPELGEKFALIVLNNTVSKAVLEAGGHHFEPNRDTHSLLFHEMLTEPLEVGLRPIPHLITPLAAGAEAPPLSRCIPYTYES